MTKKLSILVLCLCVCLAVLTGCGCKHETWNEADCLNPRTCAECGEVEGEPLGHTWADATCVNPKTCSACGETEGEALGHTWADADCVNPKTCTVCGETEGEALGHTWADATCDTAKTCTVCAETEGEALGHSFGDWVELDAENEEHTCTVCGYTEQQAIDRMAQFLSYMQGTTWETAFVYLDGIGCSPEDFTDPSAVESYFYFNEDGSIQQYVFGSTYDVVIDETFGVNFTVDGETKQYGFILFDGADYASAVLDVEQDGSMRLWVYYSDALMWVYDPSV